jgi:hypothetical protein
MNNNQVELEVRHTNFSTPGYTMVRLPQHLLDEIKKECAEIQNNFENYSDNTYNIQLIGQIEKEYQLHHTPVVLDKFLNTFVKHYYDHWVKKDVNDHEFKIHEAWVNFQKKHEFNPIHNHSGLLSFVLWIQIPYDLNEELALNHSSKSNRPCSSIFNFHYVNMKGDLALANIPVSKEHEGILMLFPSWLNHSVNPFYTSDDYRISVSGNIISTTEGNLDFFA